MSLKVVLIYFACINLISGLLFSFDKCTAIKGRRRISEQTLHFLELLGGVFTNIVLMYTLRHKNRKFSYYAVTYLLIIGWIALILYEF